MITHNNHFAVTVMTMTVLSWSVQCWCHEHTMIITFLSQSWPWLYCHNQSNADVMITHNNHFPVSHTPQTGKQWINFFLNTTDFLYHSLWYNCLLSAGGQAALMRGREGKATWKCGRCPTKKAPFFIFFFFFLFHILFFYHHISVF